MSTMKTISNMNELELQYGIEKGSWHDQYRNSAYIYVGGLNYELTEGDIGIVFSQYGEIVDINLARDKVTGKPKGFAFLAYEDQRSTILAVDNLNGIDIGDRKIRVDHVQDYKPPKEFTENNDEEKIYKPSGPDGLGWGSYRDYTPEETEAFKKYSEFIQEKKSRVENQYEELENAKKMFIVDEDERWEKKLINEIDNDNDENLFERVQKEAKRLKKLKKKERKEAKKSKKEAKHKGIKKVKMEKKGIS